jgi:hypothetical protein
MVVIGAEVVSERSVEFRSRLEPGVANAIGLGCSLRRKPEVQEHVRAVAQIGLYCWLDRCLYAYRLPNINIGRSIAYLPNACAICPTSLAQGMSIAA